FLIVSFFAIVLGKTFPKKLSVKNYKRLAFSCVPIISLLGTFFRPLTFLIFKTTNGVARLFGIDPNREDKEITEDTIRMMVDEGNVNGTIELQEREMINNIFEFDDRTAGDVMTHRTDIVAVSIDDKLIDVVKSAVA
ncbi:MAG: CNNM domain-containing protein, partial [Oscillospiraceae bacterium]